MDVEREQGMDHYLEGQRGLEEGNTDDLEAEDERGKVEEDSSTLPMEEE